jgi:hypothetical protein
MDLLRGSTTNMTASYITVKGLGGVASIHPVSDITGFSETEGMRA